MSHSACVRGRAVCVKVGELGGESAREEGGGDGALVLGAAHDLGEGEGEGER